jgi:hypothetical protein
LSNFLIKLFFSEASKITFKGLNKWATFPGDTRIRDVMHPAEWTLVTDIQAAQLEKQQMLDLII